VAVRTQVEQVIEVIRPAIQADNGDVVLHDVDEATGFLAGRLRS
jgi:Fe-S cluster biogenesis protein NfuA